MATSGTKGWQVRVTRGRSGKCIRLSSHKTKKAATRQAQRLVRKDFWAKVWVESASAPCLPSRGR